MKSNSHDLAIRWKTIHELTRFFETKTRSNDNKIVEIFEPRPFDTVIQPRLMNWSDLEVPRQWLIQALVGQGESSKTKNLAQLQMQASGKKFIYWKYSSKN